MFKLKSLVSSFVLSVVIISASLIPVQAAIDPYQDVSPEMREAVMETNNVILKDKMQNPRLRTTERWVLKSTRSLSGSYVGDTSFPATIPAATSVSNQKTKTVTMKFSITASVAEDITGIAGISYGTTSSMTTTEDGPGYNDRLSNGMAANYAYIVGTSKFRVYEYTYEIQNSMGKVLRIEKEKAVVHEKDSSYALMVNEEKVKVNVENWNRNRVLTWNSYTDYFNDLIYGNPDEAADNCIFF